MMGGMSCARLWGVEMPREDAAESESGPLVFAGIVQCDACENEFEGVWMDEAVDYEQLVDPPVGELTCPVCGQISEYEYTGFWNYDDAG